MFVNLRQSLTFLVGWICLQNGGRGLVESVSPPHDLCVNATNVDGLLPFEEDESTALATTDGTYPLCSVISTGKGVWYSVTGTDKWASVTVRSTYYYAQIVLFQQEKQEGSVLCQDMVCRSNNRQFGRGYGPHSLQWFAQLGETYKILVTNYYSSYSGAFNVKITDYDPPRGDSCSNATEILSLPFEQDGSTFASLYDETDSVCGVVSGSRGVWYQFKGTGKWTSIRFTTTFPYKQIVLYEKQGGDASCDDLLCVGNSRASSSSSTAVRGFVSEAGVTYYMLLTSYSQGGTGDYGLDIMDYNPPVNNECSGATKIDSLPFAQDGSTFAALYDEADSVCGVVTGSRGVWFQFSGTGKWTSIRLTTSFPYKQIVVYRKEAGKSCEDLVCVGHARASSSSTALRYFLSEEGVTYHVLVTSYSQGGTGDYSLHISDYDPPVNNNCAEATTIDSLPFEQDGSTFASLYDETDSVCGVVSGSRGVWYQFKGTGKWTSIRFTTTFPYKQIVLYEKQGGDASCDDLLCVGNSRASSSSSTAVRNFVSESGVTYYMLLTSYSQGMTGDFGLDIISNESPANDNCEGAYMASRFPYEVQGDATYATRDFPDEDSVCGVVSGSRGVWYTFVGDGSVTTISYYTPNRYKQLSIYKGSCDNLVCLQYQRVWSGTTVATIDTELGGTYYILATWYGSDASGDYKLTIRSTAPTPLPTAQPTQRTVADAGLYGTSGYKGSVASTSDLYTIDPESGSSSRIGPILVDDADQVLIDGLSYDEYTGRMLAHTSSESPKHPNAFLSVNTRNARAKIIGSSNLNVTGLAIRSNGVAYSWMTSKNSSGISGGLVLVSTLHGYTTLVGESEISTTDVGLAFDSDGMLHLLNNEGDDHFLVNTVTGSLSILGAFEPLIGTVHGDIMPGTSLYFAPSNDDIGIIQIYDLDTSGLQSEHLQTGILGLHTLAFVEDETPAPTENPTSRPPTTNMPSSRPSITPSSTPSTAPSEAPSSKPSYLPSVSPSIIPSAKPSEMPSFPTMSPSGSPTDDVVFNRTAVVISEELQLDDQGRVLVPNATGEEGGVFTTGDGGIFEADNIIIRLPSQADLEDTICDSGGAVIRIIKSISIESFLGGLSCPTAHCLLLHTEEATLSDLASQSFLDSIDLGAFAMASVEQAIRDVCAVARPTGRRELEKEEPGDMPLARNLQFGWLFVPDDCGEWQDTINQGQCKYSRCNVGPEGDPFDCFSCGRTCDNTCGPAIETIKDGIINAIIIEGVPGIYDFSESCCIHDHCYGSIFSKLDCDLSFLVDMLRSCGTDEVEISGLPFPKLGSNTVCEVIGVVYFLGVFFGGDDAYAAAQASELAHSLSPTCRDIENTQGNTATFFGDPHLITFDGLKFDCHAEGETVLVRSLASLFEIQARFSSVGYPTVTTGIVIRERDANLPIIQASVSEGPDPVLDIAGCPVDIYLDGVLLTPDSIESLDGVSIVTSSREIVVEYPSTGSKISMVISSFRGACYMSGEVTIDPSRSDSDSIVGLLGSLNGDPNDDWMTPNGTALTLPSGASEFFFEPAFEYCAENWCLQSETESLFAYNSGFNFTYYENCQRESNAASLEVSVADAPEWLLQLCNGDIGCVIDGLTLGRGAADDYLLWDRQISSRRRLIPGRLFNTGVGDDGVALPAGSSDPHYTVVETGLPARVITAIPSSYFPGNNGSTWIWENPNGLPVNVDRAFETTFDLSGLNPENVEITGSWGVDNIGIDILVNGNSTGISLPSGTNFGMLANFMISFGFVEGENVLRFLTRDVGEVSGFRLDHLALYATTDGTNRCEGGCDDGNPCTTDFCLGGICRTEPLTCGTGQSCDPFSGKCQDDENLVPCVAVIDEWNGRNYGVEWANFRQRFPTRPFCLLVPNGGVQTLPNGFDSDTVNNVDGMDRTTVSTVNRDNGNSPLASDWFEICKLDQYPSESIRFVGLFVDNSGSMTVSTVQASLNLFESKVAEAGMTINRVINSQERWIDPFLTTLVPPVRG